MATQVVLVHLLGVRVLPPEHTEVVMNRSPAGLHSAVLSPHRLAA